MKKIFKLKGQMIVAVILSIIIAWLVCMPLESLRKKPDNNEYIRESHSYSSEITKNIVNMKLYSHSDDYIEKVLDEESDKYKGREKPQFYLTDGKGSVIYCNIKNAVNNINISGKNEIIEIHDRYFVCTNIIKISDSRYIAVVTSGYAGNDLNVIIMWAVIAVLVFFILVYGMVNYLNKISVYVRKIAHGDLNTRVPVKYNNEISDLAKNINYMAEELSEHDAKQKEFITNISHDLRTPLTTMMGYLDMIEENKYDDEAELKHYIDIIRRKASYLKSMMEDFFYYSKLSSDDIPLQITRINLNECLNMIMEEEDETFKNNNLNITKDLCSEDAFIDGDPMLIARIIQNLLSNAVKYSKKDTDVIVKLKKCEEKTCIVSVSNIPMQKITEDDLEKIFNRLYKKDKSRKNGGSGLGLAIAKEIIKKHDGAVWAEIKDDRLVMKIKLNLSKS